MNWQTIAEYLVTTGFEPKAVQGFRELLDIPDDPVELPRVIANFRHLVPYLTAVAVFYPDILEETTVPDGEALCRAIQGHPEWAAITHTSRKPRKKPLTGYYLSHPNYVIFWEMPPVNAGVTTFYYQLFVHVCLATVALRKRIATDDQDSSVSKADKKTLKDVIYRGSLAIRTLAAVEHGRMLKNLSNLEIGPDSLLPVIAGDHELLMPIHRLIEFFLEKRHPEHRIAGGRRSFSKSWSLIRAISNPGYEPEFKQLIKKADVCLLSSSTQADDADAYGCASEEDNSEVEMYVPHDALPDPQSKDQKVDGARSIKARFAMDNQMLPFRWGTLSTSEISIFIAALEDLLRKRGKSSYAPKNGDPVELGALLTTSFWLGKDCNQLHKLNCILDDVPSNTNEPAFVVQEQTGFWWTVPAVRPRKKYPDEQQKTQTLPVVPIFPMESGIGIEDIICEYAQKLKTRNGSKLFSGTVSRYERNIDDFLSIVNQKHGTRLTAVRIADYLFNTISRRKGADLTTAMYLTGRSHFLGINHSSYSAISVPRLQKTYREVCLDILHRVGNKPPVPEDQKQPRPQLPKCAGFVGSPFVPTPKTVRILCETLKNNLNDCSREAPSILKLARLHKHMTLYTAYLVGFCTGFRAVNDPFLNAAEINWQSGFAVVRDKDNEDGYNSRLIWLPPVCLEQLQLFKEHLAHAECRFASLIPDFQEQLRRHSPHGPGRRMFFVAAESGFTVSPAIPKLLTAAISDDYYLPFNATRHFLRTFLLQAKCPIEVINALMGHWERGEEPWGTFSGLSPHTYRDTLKVYLQPLITAAGWEAVPGLGVTL